MREPIINVKTRDQLYGLMDYIQKHPTERFWQALKNWSGRGFVWVSDSNEFDPKEFHDTFHDE
jgi:hypothetical protein